MAEKTGLGVFPIKEATLWSAEESASLQQDFTLFSPNPPRYTRRSKFCQLAPLYQKFSDTIHALICNNHENSWYDPDIADSLPEKHSVISH